MRLLAFLSILGLALLGHATASADDLGSRSGWVRIETDKGCVAYLSGTPDFYTTKAYRWSEQCVAGQPIAGSGRLAMYMDGKVWVQSGRFEAGYFEGNFTEERFTVVNGTWDDSVPGSRMWRAMAKGGCLYAEDQREKYRYPDWEGCIPRGGSRAVRAPRRVFSAVSAHSRGGSTVSAPGKPTTYPIAPAAAQAVADARAAGASGNHMLAIQRYTDALAVDSGNLLMLVERGIQYQLQGQVQQAIGDFTTAIAKNPNYATAYYYRSGAYKQLGQTSLAYSDAASALRLAPDDKGVQARAQAFGVPPLPAAGGAPPPQAVAGGSSPRPSPGAPPPSPQPGATTGAPDALPRVSDADCGKHLNELKSQIESGASATAETAGRLGRAQKEFILSRCDTQSPIIRMYGAMADINIRAGLGGGAGPGQGGVGGRMITPPPVAGGARPPAAGVTSRNSFPVADRNQCLQKVDLENVFLSTSTQVSFRNICGEKLRVQVCYLNPTIDRYVCSSEPGGLMPGKTISVRAQLRDVPDRHVIYKYAGCSQKSVDASSGSNCGGDANARGGASF